MSQIPEQRPSREDPPYDTSGISLLYVEDENDARDMVTRMIAMNYPELRLYAAENGLAGLESYRSHAPDIVVTDINMPVLDGIRMAREIKSINPDALIIAVTAHSDTSYLLNAINIGIHHYVLKPINYDELFRAIDRTVEEIVLKRLVREQNRRISASERQLAEAQRIAHLGSWQWDLAASTVGWSEELSRICGLPASSVPVPYREFVDLIHPEDRPALGRQLRRALESRKPLVAHFCRIVRPDGGVRILRVDAEVVGDPPVSVIGTSLDVTELKQAEQEIRSLTDELEKRVAQRTSLLQASLRELENFSYVVSHDLRAPLARLEGFCRALLEDCGDCGNLNCRTYAERAEQVVLQIKSIIDAFNDLSRYAKCRMVVEEIDLAALARGVVERLRALEPGREVECRIAERVLVRGDPRLLQVVLEELLGNAWKFTSKTRRARIEFGWAEREGARVFFVRDNGAGFNMKYADKLFKPFQTIHSPGEFPAGGTATGLAAVHSIVLRHGGGIWAEGEVDKGATFYFTLEKNPEPGSYVRDH